ncbi:energy-coupling factor ABC transporter substrate-binding protein [Rhodobacter capsulatus]|jgi:cobalt/nickel transport protein|uniref:Cobalt transport protein CbiN n=1 Tax=Rhodobacter capsulatus (strain ATCC BAA-309 / NBRC 16581 / SB1003) TaxID=272942 RepID=CBIN_RHOCB|nr:energy-coupling factor ABC transporter substrate-binding protein [Rhodobacter capsulatus]O68104.1 RecName: Full=Cobalt transport protein CbiN; AltName: Full=Energy-coupling factor transporter probable substrate-capture protein CbiN; Short=ECF transporter S component CbiN [Rhodobacter capsulatus SB 1003]AAC16194.1 cobalt transport protein CbiN [Rhodobacter capsulatus SB 1003]ADE85780.1 cobalt transport protein CbiN [Rhodobacter capsulatus SB 1003]ETD01780.1 cobalt ABC transporter [Rhodobacter
MSSKRTLWLLAGTVALVVVPLLMGGEFGGADGQAAELIEATVPGFAPWADPLWEPPSGEVESLFFALQAALGAFVVGLVIGRRQGAAKTREQNAPAPRSFPAE